jgi:hypothetical protein
MSDKEKAERKVRNPETTEKDKRKEHISRKENEAQQGCPAFQSGVGRPGLFT